MLPRRRQISISSSRIQTETCRLNALPKAMTQVSSRVGMGTQEFHTGTHAALITDDWGLCLRTLSWFDVAFRSKA